MGSRCKLSQLGESIGPSKADHPLEVRRARLSIIGTSCMFKGTADSTAVECSHPSKLTLRGVVDGETPGSSWGVGADILHGKKRQGSSDKTEEVCLVEPRHTYSWAMRRPIMGQVYLKMTSQKQEE